MVQGIGEHRNEPNYSTVQELSRGVGLEAKKRESLNVGKEGFFCLLDHWQKLQMSREILGYGVPTSKQLCKLISEGYWGKGREV